MIKFSWGRLKANPTIWQITYSAESRFCKINDLINGRVSFEEIGERQFNSKMYST